MCGIAVVVTGARVDTAGAEVALARRGPDATAAARAGSATFVASQLIHWTAGSASQPYVEADGSTAVFNGELFNLEDLAAGLVLPGGSEIAVLVAGLRGEGLEFLRRIDGQFAAIVRFGADGPVLAVRDRFGVCPCTSRNNPAASPPRPTSQPSWP